jgi:hypothetical protein
MRAERQMMNESFEKLHTAMVFVGPQGCGKSVHARNAAQALGPFQEIGVEELACKFWGWFEVGTKALIVEGWPSGGAGVAAIKRLLGAKRMLVHRKGEFSLEADVPKLIFCTSDERVLESLAGDRRFDVVNLGVA